MSFSNPLLTEQSKQNRQSMQRDTHMVQRTQLNSRRVQRKVQLPMEQEQQRLRERYMLRPKFQVLPLVQQLGRHRPEQKGRKLLPVKMHHVYGLVSVVIYRRQLGTQKIFNFYSNLCGITVYSTSSHYADVQYHHA